MINVNDTDIVKQAKFHTLKMEQDALDIILSSRNKEKPGKTVTGRVTKEEIWDYLANFFGVMHNEEFVVNGQLCTTRQIEKMGKDVLQEMKAVDNVLVLESGVYYGVTTNEGGLKIPGG